MNRTQKANVIQALKWLIVGLENGKLQPMPGSKADMKIEAKHLTRFTLDLQFIAPEGDAVTDVVSRPPSMPAAHAIP